ncbi:MAG: MBL fold metallo-hydrolase [Leptolyngbyaceae bacterium]|nr:MBL fold metallo-hydrolase [Leptolyngbyaceae bacterium]
MKRRKLIRYGIDGLFAAVGVGLWHQLGQPVVAQTSPLSIQWLGHMCFLFTGNGKRLLVNPFDPIGCTAGYPAPSVTVDYVMLSSRLLDEGYPLHLPGQPELLTTSGIYPMDGGLEVEGILSDHDLVGGERFGDNIMWRWVQSGVRIAHLGGAAAPITDEQLILIRRPDVLLLPVGGGIKAYNPQQAKDAIARLNPKIVIPTQYRTAAADEQSCDLVGVDAFVNLMGDVPVQRLEGNTLTLASTDLPQDGMRIVIFNR